MEPEKGTPVGCVRKGLYDLHGASVLLGRVLQGLLYGSTGHITPEPSGQDNGMTGKLENTAAYRFRGVI